MILLIQTRDHAAQQVAQTDVTTAAMIRVATQFSSNPLGGVFSESLP
jgi:hypothetical protein